MKKSSKPKASAARSKSAAPKVDPKSKRPQILMIVTSRSFPTQTLDFIRDSGFDLHVQPFLPKALSEMRIRPFDFIILEISGPRSGEFRTLQLLRQVLHMKVGVVTGNKDKSFQTQVKQLFPTFLAVLPVSRHKLTVLLKNALTREVGSIEEALPLFNESSAPSKAHVQVIKGPVSGNASDIKPKDKKTHDIEVLRAPPEEHVPERVMQYSQHLNQPSSTLMMYLDETTQKIIQGCVDIYQKVWDEKNLYTLLRNISTYYWQDDVALVIYSYAHEDFRVILHSRFTINEDTGSEMKEVYEETMSKSLEGYVLEFVKSLGRMDAFYEYTDKKKTIHMGVPLYFNENFASILLMNLKRKAIRGAHLSQEIHGFFSLGEALRVSVIGKRSLVEMYKEYYRKLFLRHRDKAA